MIFFASKKYFLFWFLFFSAMLSVIVGGYFLEQNSFSPKSAPINLKEDSKKYIPQKRSINCSKKSCIALTFDDGPGRYTQKLLDILKQRNVKATFFIIGSKIEKKKDLLERMAKEWHQIGNHSWTHPNFTKISEAERKNELANTSNKIEEVTWIKTSIFRPPFWAINEEIEKETRYPIILWDVDTRDWDRPKTETIIANALEWTQTGSIILIHDIYERSVEAIPRIVDTLQAGWFTFVTIEELFSTGGLEKGKVYTRRK